MTADARQRAALPCAVQALERYGANLLCLADGEDPGIRFALWRDLQEVRRALLPLAGLQAAWTLLLISHHELLALADSSASAVPAGALHVHRMRLDALARLCRELQVGTHAPRPQSSEACDSAAADASSTFLSRARHMRKDLQQMQQRSRRSRYKPFRLCRTLTRRMP